MKNVKTIAYAFISLISLFFILCFKSLPGGQLWKNYSVLYVPVESSDAEVLSALEKSGIYDVVYLSGQYLPILISENSPEFAMYKLNRNNEEFAYSSKRNSYFFDKSKEFRLYYIPNEYKSKIAHCISILSTKNISAGIDSNSSYPWVLPIICTCITIFLLFFVKNKLLFTTTAILPVIFIFCNPFYPAAIANVLIQLTLFFIANIWKRDGSIKFLAKNYVILTMAGISIVTPFSCSIKSGFLFLICAAGVFSLFILYGEYEKYRNSKYSFQPIYIRPAKMISIFANKQKIVMTSLTFSGFLIVLFFIILSSDTINAHFSKLLLPSPAAIQTEALPSLDDYYDWTWKVISSPYCSLNKDSDNKTIEYSRFTDENGKITEYVQTKSFNQDFIENTYNDIDNFGFESIEKVLKSQKKDIKTGYTSTNSYHIGIFGIIMMLFSLSILLFIYISIIIRKGAKK